MKRTLTLWTVWLIATLSGGVVLVAGMVYGGPTRAKLLIGETTHGHYQIELACGACHTSAFGGTDEVDKTCQSCHADELKQAKDSHPLKKFRDPRNADSLQLSENGLTCKSCHFELEAYEATFRMPYPHAVGMAMKRAGLAKVEADEMVQLCLVVTMDSKPLPWQSRDLAALKAFVLEERQRYRQKSQ